MRIILAALGSALLVAYALYPVAAQDHGHDTIFSEARALLVQGQYAEAISAYDELLDAMPGSVDILHLKGIAQSNSNQHEESLITFYTILRDYPQDEIALAGAGIGFGNLGEYQESRSYFASALAQNPDSKVYRNYVDFVDGVIAKYPYKPTSKPDQLALPNRDAIIPQWVSNIASWWASGIISDHEFISAIDYLLDRRAIVMPPVPRSDAGVQSASSLRSDMFYEWAAGDVTTPSIANAIRELARAGLVTIPPQEPAEAEREKIELLQFKNYLRQIIANAEREKRYIEYPNPSGEVIKKFLRDYVKWNFDQEVQHASSGFPDPKIEVVDDNAVIHYNVYVNQQPSGLPLDHVSTLKTAFRFWEAQTIMYGDQNTRVKINVVDTKKDANVWVTWVVRDLGEGVLGHAHVGKGVVEVALGDYACDGSFQLYDVATVLEIMTHELGHSVGLGHADDPDSIMYPTMTPSYAYCLL